MRTEEKKMKPKDVEAKEGTTNVFIHLSPK